MARAAAAWCLAACGFAGFMGVGTRAQGLAGEQREAVEGYGAALVRGLNAGPESDAATIESVFAADTIASVGTDRLKGFLERIRRDFGTLEFHHAEVAEFFHDGQARRVLHVYARQPGANQWKDFQCRLEPTPPFRVTQLAFVAEVAEPVYLPNGAITSEDTRTWLDGYISRLVRQNHLSGSLLIREGDRTIFERVYGAADAAGTVPVTATTRFNLGSGNKMMTAVALAQLVEKGLVSFSDPIAKYFPGFPDQDRARRTTIHHLLSHTSGIGEYWTAEYERHWNDISTPEQQLPWVYKAGATFEPGARFEYSNSNFVLAGLIVERVGHTSYFDYVKTHIFEPAGMTATGFPLMDGSVQGLADRLRRTEQGWQDSPHGLRGGPAGGGYSTAADMARFIRAFVDGRLVSPAMVRTITTSKTATLPDAPDYGYGFIVGQSGDQAYFGHGGTATGVNFELAYFPASDTTFVIFCNQDNGAYDDLKKNTIKLISGAR